MKELRLEAYKEGCAELETFLADSIVRYGIDQLKGNKPKKRLCCFRDARGKVISGVMGSATLNLFFISHLFVEPEYRNRGLGSKLLSTIESLAIEAGCDTVRLNTFNKKAHTLYLRAGFKETTRIPDYMAGFDLVYYHKQIS